LLNVYGLAFVRLRDDLVDGDLDSESWDWTIALGTALHKLWLSGYLKLFAGSSPFWTHFDEYMGQWLRATLGANDAPARELHSSDLAYLGQRGAPLKICCVAACLLAGREEDVAPLTSAIGSLLIAAVLMDHAEDWVEDLGGGRYNALVAYASREPQVPENFEQNRLRVLEAIYLGGGARPYFELVRTHIQAAIGEAEKVDCPGLRDFLFWFERKALAYGERMAVEARARLRAASQQVFGVPKRVGPLGTTRKRR
jgi:hypothetical protein